MKVKTVGKFLNFLLFDNVIAICLAPFGIYIRVLGRYTISHEKIHWKQQMEMLIIFFYLWYLIEYAIRSFKPNAYRNISFEREAYTNEKNPNYLEERKPYAWIKYLKK